MIPLLLFGFMQLAMERELASLWKLSFVVPPDHGTLPCPSWLSSSIGLSLTEYQLSLYQYGFQLVGRWFLFPTSCLVSLL